MKDLKDKTENVIEKVQGKIIETTGKITGDEQMELKGKLKVSKADFEKKIDDKVKKVKNDVAEKVNKAMDKK